MPGPGATSGISDLEAKLRAYAAEFSRLEVEDVTNAIPNAAAADFLLANVPLFECPDTDIERTYYFRWWTYRKHLRKDEEGGWSRSFSIMSGTPAKTTRSRALWGTI